MIIEIVFYAMERANEKMGRYMYKYIDNAGNVKYVYSWKLVKTDTVPQGAKKTMFHFEIRKSRYIRIWKMILFLLAVE